jgi:hypothetical protein
LIGAQERFLSDILRVGRIAKDAVGYLKNASLVLSDALAKSRLGFRRLGFQYQRTHEYPCHAYFPLHV